MRILVIGCGSIGQRHIKNLLFLNAGQILAFDIDQIKLDKVKALLPQIIVSADLDKLWALNPAIVFITLPSALHIDYAMIAAKRGCHLFIEKPLSNTLKQVKRLINLVNRQKLITLVGCNLRFYWAVAKIKELLKRKCIGKVVSARIETGEYLPDWHLHEDYRRLYSANKSQGGVVLDAIHEIDYAGWFFGEVDAAVVMYGKLSSLEIESEDIAEIIFKYKKGPLVNIHLDYIQRSYARGCKVIGEAGTIVWEINEHRVKWFSANAKHWEIFSEPSQYQINQMYIDEVKYFLRCVKKKKATFNDVIAGAKTLALTLKVKKQGQRVV
ncbi:MAG: Gfo/Idh/MocA family oxidoreductase [Candidatus Margulisiibacteriota bacterium]